MVDANARFARCAAFVLAKSQEGDFVDDPQDPGGATNHGITIGTLSHYLGRPATVVDVRALDEATAQKIYRTCYWPPADNLPEGIDLLYFNAAVNCGPGHAAQFLQAAAHVAVDGHLGPVTMAAINKADAYGAINAFADAQRAYYRTREGFSHDGKGWLARTMRAVDLAESWVHEAALGRRGNGASA